MYNCLITKTSLMGLVELSKTAYISITVTIKVRLILTDTNSCTNQKAVLT
jgi:hypothetical protein